MLQQQTVPGVVVLGSDFKALGFVRSLGERGIPSIVIDNQPRSAWFSRYVIKHLRWHNALEGEEFLYFLLTVCKRYHLEQWLLIPAQDDAVQFVAYNTQQLAHFYQPVTQNWDVLRWALDKRLTYQMALETQVASPKTWYPNDENALKEMDIQFPAIIKPAISIHFQTATRLKALPANSYEELLAHFRFVSKIIPPDEIMVQELIPGTGHSQYSVATYCKHGDVLLSMTARRVRQYPIDYGLSSSFVEAIEVPILLEPTRRILRRMAVSGMVEVEFKYDSRDNQYKLLDINVRPWGWHTLCIACGLDFPYIQYCDTLGQPPETVFPKYGSHWTRLLTDIPAGMQEIKAGISTPRTYLRSFRGKTVFSVFDWRDPLPVVGDFAVALARSIKSFYSKGS